MTEIRNCSLNCQHYSPETETTGSCKYNNDGIYVILGAQCKHYLPEKPDLGTITEDDFPDVPGGKIHFRRASRGGTGTLHFGHRF